MRSAIVTIVTPTRLSAIRPLHPERVIYPSIRIMQCYVSRRRRHICTSSYRGFSQVPVFAAHRTESVGHHQLAFMYARNPQLKILYHSNLPKEIARERRLASMSLCLRWHDDVRNVPTAGYGDLRERLHEHSLTYHNRHGSGGT